MNIKQDMFSNKKRSIPAATSWKGQDVLRQTLFSLRQPLFPQVYKMWSYTWTQKTTLSCHDQAECYKCHKKGHFGNMCRPNPSVQVVAASLNIGEDPDESLGVIQVDIATVSPDRMIILSLNKCALEFKIDMGADVTGIPEKLYTEN